MTEPAARADIEERWLGGSAVPHLLFAAIAGLALYARWPASPARLFWLDEGWRVAAVLETSTVAELIERMREVGGVLTFSEWWLPRLILPFTSEVQTAFRIWPLAASMVALVLAYLFLRRVASSSGALFACLLIATGPLFITESRHFKPYGVDLACTMACLYLATLERDRRGGIGVLVGSSLAALSSLTVVFVLPGVALFRFWRRWPRDGLEWASILVPGLLILGQYFLFLRPQGVGFLTGFWADFYLDSADHALALLGRAPKYLNRYVPYVWPVVVFSTFILVPAAAWRAQSRLWMLLLPPFALHMIASALGRYPVLERPAYYAYGLLAVSAAVGIHATAQSLKRADLRRAVEQRTFVILGLVALVGGLLRMEGSRNSPADQGRLALETLRDEVRAGDLLVLNYGATYPARLHGKSIVPAHGELIDDALTRVDEIQPLIDRNPQVLCEGFRRIAAGMSPGTRVWIYSAHVKEAYDFYEPALGALGPVALRVADKKQSLIRLDLERDVSSLACPGRE